MMLAAVPTQGQDLLARQAPIDRKMKAVDSVALIRLIQYEQMESPAANIPPMVVELIDLPSM